MAMFSSYVSLPDARLTRERSVCKACDSWGYFEALDSQKTVLSEDVETDSTDHSGFSGASQASCWLLAGMEVIDSSVFRQRGHVFVKIGSCCCRRFAIICTL